MSESVPEGHARGTTDVSSDGHSIAIRLSTYGDLFSHFDPRPYAARALSDDLLTEIARPRVPHSTGAPQLDLERRGSERNAGDEAVIRERLHRHFQERAEALQAQRHHAVTQGIVLSLIGTLMLLGSALVRTYVHDDLAAACLTVVLEPGGWYAIWYGFDELFYGARRIASEYAFQRRMTDAHIVFSGG